MVSMLHRTKYKIIIATFTLFISLSIRINAEAEVIADTTNLIDTMQIIQNDSLELDTLSCSAEGELSFYEGYVEPVVAVVFSVLVTLLLFSVRSKK